MSECACMDGICECPVRNQDPYGDTSSAGFFDCDATLVEHDCLCGDYGGNYNSDYQDGHFHCTDPGDIQDEDECWMMGYSWEWQMSTCLDYWRAVNNPGSPGTTCEDVFGESLGMVRELCCFDYDSPSAGCMCNDYGGNRPEWEMLSQQWKCSDGVSCTEDDCYSNGHNHWYSEGSTCGEILPYIESAQQCSPDVESLGAIRSACCYGQDEEDVLCDGSLNHEAGWVDEHGTWYDCRKLNELVRLSADLFHQHQIEVFKSACCENYRHCQCEGDVSWDWTSTEDAYCTVFGGEECDRNHEHWANTVVEHQECQMNGFSWVHKELWMSCRQAVVQFSAGCDLPEFIKDNCCMPVPPDHSDAAGLIILAVVLVVLGLCARCCLWFFCCRKKDKDAGVESNVAAQVPQFSVPVNIFIQMQMPDGTVQLVEQQMVNGMLAQPEISKEGQPTGKNILVPLPPVVYL